jgi:hypothetical protein
MRKPQYGHGSGHPDAEGAEVTQKTQKEEMKDEEFRRRSCSFPRLLRNFCVFCVRMSGFAAVQ